MASARNCQHDSQGVFEYSQHHEVCTQVAIGLDTVLQQLRQTCLLLDRVRAATVANYFPILSFADEMKLWEGVRWIDDHAELRFNGL